MHIIFLCFFGKTNTRFIAQVEHFFPMTGGREMTFFFGIIKNNFLLRLYQTGKKYFHTKNRDDFRS